MNEERNKAGGSTTQQQHPQAVGRDKGQGESQRQQPGSQNRGQASQGSSPAGAPGRPGTQEKNKKDEGSCGCDGSADMAGKKTESKGGSNDSED